MYMTSGGRVSLTHTERDGRDPEFTIVIVYVRFSSGETERGFTDFATVRLGITAVTIAVATVSSCDARVSFAYVIVAVATMRSPSKIPGFTWTATWKLWGPSATSLNCQDRGPRAIPPSDAEVSASKVVFGERVTFAHTADASVVPVLLKYTV